MGVLASRYCGYESRWITFDCSIVDCMSPLLFSVCYSDVGEMQMLADKSTVVALISEYLVQFTEAVANVEDQNSVMIVLCGCFCLAKFRIYASINSVVPL